MNVANLEHWLDKIVLYGLIIYHALQHYGLADSIKNFFIREAVKVEDANPQAKGPL